MKELKKKLATTQSVLTRFEEVLVRVKTAQEPDEYKMLLDAAIQRFEFTYEITWRLLRLYLEKIKLVALDQLTSPRQIFRVAVQVGFLSENDFETVSSIIENRNQTTHMYDEDVAEEISKKFPEYVVFLKSVIGHIAQDVSEDLIL